jgi:mannose-6-phosphate isomerase-like protein (cupin superfamily)
MRIEKADPNKAKGWYLGPWNADLGISLGYANAGIDEPHFHREMTEVYFMAQGTATLRIEKETLLLAEGDVIVIEPGEAHTFLASSPNHLHFVLQTPGLQGEQARLDKVLVPRSRLGCME